jgi:hypothetical protein
VFYIYNNNVCLQNIDKNQYKNIKQYQNNKINNKINNLFNILFNILKTCCEKY